MKTPLNNIRGLLRQRKHTCEGKEVTKWLMRTLLTPSEIILLKNVLLED